MKKCKKPSGFFSKNIGAPYGKKKGLMAPTSNSPSICYLASNYSYRL